jgi:hypothetical protein
MFLPLVFFASYLLHASVNSVEDGYIRRTNEETSNKPKFQNITQIPDQGFRRVTKIDRSAKDPTAVDWHRDDVPVEKTTLS